ncbi:MAG: acyltransferase [Bacteroidota bacterium]|nr:acyltransferase [Bacteroidota bacterium]
MPQTQHETPRTGLKYQPQLSGLRFCAVLFVVIYHFSNVLTNLKYVYDLGVFIVFFFVLSSYLITRILLNAKRKAIQNGFGRWKVAIAFLTRRTLRIFPAYYFYLLLLLLLPLQGQEVRHHLGMYFFYLSNVLLHITKTWGPFTVHLWTLAVEEQFYLVWPWIILFIPNKYLTKVFTAMVIAGVLFRVISISNMTEQNMQIFPMLVLAPACMDCFAAGAILAYYHNQGYTNNKWLKWLLIGIIPIWLFLIFSHHRRIFLGMDRVFVSLFAVTIIDTANRGYTGITKKFLENSVVQYLSKISYSIYLYHLIVTVFFWKIFEVAQHYFSGYDLSFIGRVADSPYGGFFIYMALAIGCASISWYCLEQPINNLKRLVAYVMPGKKKTE